MAQARLKPELYRLASRGIVALSGIWTSDRMSAAGQDQERARTEGSHIFQGLHGIQLEAGLSFAQGDLQGHKGKGGETGATPDVADGLLQIGIGAISDDGA